MPTDTCSPLATNLDLFRGPSRRKARGRGCSNHRRQRREATLATHSRCSPRIPSSSTRWPSSPLGETRMATAGTASLAAAPGEVSDCQPAHVRASCQLDSPLARWRARGQRDLQRVPPYVYAARLAGPHVLPQDLRPPLEPRERGREPRTGHALCGDVIGDARKEEHVVVLLAQVRSDLMVDRGPA